MMKFFSFTVMVFFSIKANAFVTTLSTSQPAEDQNIITVDYKMETHSGEESLEHFQQTVGTMFYPFSTISVQKKLNSKVYVNTQYETGAFGLRKINPKLLNPEAPKHLILAGDSFIFGDGNSDDETLVAKLSAQLKSYQIYNFGYIGGAPNYTLSLMENFPWSQGVSQKGPGLFVYYFNSDAQTQAVIGSMQVMKWSQGLGPYYKLNWKGDLERDGNFNNRFFWTRFYKWLNQFSWINGFNKDYPRAGGTDAELMAKMFSRMKALYSEQFPDSPFIVAIKGPEKLSTKAFIVKLKEQLEALGIDSIDMKAGMTQPETVLLPKYDFHPNGAGNSLVASELIEKLRFAMEK